MPEGGKPVEPGIIARAGRSLANRINEWFGPDLPQHVSAPVGTAPRSQDYPVAYNIQIQPRNLEAISFAQMRSLADSFDLVRLCIETRKDQVSRMPWEFRLKKKTNQSKAEHAKANQGDKRIQELNDFFAFPDKEHTWAQWIRMLLEDLLVLDAPTIVPVIGPDGELWSNGKELYGLEIVDGA